MVFGNVYAKRLRRGKYSEGGGGWIWAVLNLHQQVRHNLHTFEAGESKGVPGASRGGGDCLRCLARVQGQVPATEEKRGYAAQQ